jgi:hypothetical protein
MAVTHVAWAHLTWALWLAAPVLVTVLAAMVLWWRARPPRPQGIEETIAGHREYLRVLGANASARPEAPHG